MPNPNTSSNTSTFRLSGNNSIDSLLTYDYASFGGGKWGGALGTGANLTFSFPTQWGTDFWKASYNYNEPFSTTKIALNNTQQQATRSAISKWAAVANISFTEISETSSNVGDLRFAFSSAVGAGIWGWSYLPDSNFAEAADVWINPTYATDPDWAQGSYNYFAMLHEIGHGLGLKHPGNYNAGGGGSPGPFLPGSLDTTQYSIMSYNDYRYIDPISDEYIMPSTPMVLDIQAMQYMYGANMTTNTGSNVYQFDTTAPFYMTIWDAGGTDEINISNWTNNSIINLTPGSYSSLRYHADNANTLYYTGENNLGIAYNTYIENAVGGNGNDLITGNDRANFIIGGIGNDTLEGGLGNDTLDGASGLDILIMNCLRSQCVAVLSGNNYVLTSVLGTDTISGIEQVRFLDFTVAPSSLLPNDTIPPSVEVSSSTSSLRFGQTASINFQLSEESPNFTVDDINVTGGRLSNLRNTGGNLYTATFTPEANFTGVASIRVAAGRFFDYSANFNLASNTINITLDTLPPTASISADKNILKAGETSVMVYFSLSEPVTDFVLEDITVSGAQLTNFSGSGDRYSARLSLLPDSSFATVSINTERFTDSNGNKNNVASNSLNIEQDNLRPSLQSTIPLQLATHVSVSSNIQLRFDEAIRPGAGEIIIKTVDQRVLERIALDSNRISINGNLVTIDPSQALQSGSKYIVEFAGNNFTDIAGNEWVLANNYSFTTNYLPSSSNKTISFAEDTSRVLLTSDFSFNDADNSDALQSVVIEQLPNAGELLLSDVVVNQGQIISIQDISAGNLVYVPVSNGFGNNYSQLQFKVSDGIDLSAAAYTLTFNIQGSNDIPSLTSDIQDLVWLEGQSFELALGEYFSDPDGVTDLTFKISQTNGAKLPKWLSFNSKTGVLSGKPGDADSGTIAISIQATDSSKFSLEDSFELTIENINQAPVSRFTTLATRKLDEGKSINYKLSKTLFVDPDRGDSFVLSAQLENGEDLPSWLRFNAQTGTLSGRAPFDSADHTPLTIRFTATDAQGASSSVLLPLALNNVARVRGSAKADVLNSGNGIDTVSAGAGADTVNAGLASDVIDLGKDSAIDTLVVSRGSGVDSVNNFVAGIDVVQFSDFVHRDDDSSSLKLISYQSGQDAMTLSGDTEALLLTAVTLNDVSEIGDIVQAAFIMQDVASGPLIFAIQVGSGLQAGKSFLGYLDINDVSDSTQVELLAVINSSFADSSLWLPIA